MSSVGTANIAGLASGLNFNNIVSQLMAVEQQKVSLLKTQQAQQQLLQTALGTLSSDMTSLRSQVFVPELLRYRRAGHATVALVVDTSDLLPEVRDRTDAAARRIWLAQREAERHSLESGGIPTALVTATAGVGYAILTLRRRMNLLQQPIRMEPLAR